MERHAPDLHAPADPWRRFAALVIDHFILGLALGVLTRFIPPLTPIETSLLLWAMEWLYFTLLTSGIKQGTYGKQMLGMIVVDLNGERLTFIRATLRYVSSIVSRAILLMGYLIAFGDPRRRTLHDRIAGTLVLKPDPIMQDQPGPTSTAG